MACDKKISRRILLQYAGVSALAALCLPGCAESIPKETAVSDTSGLGVLARRRGRIFGIAVQSRQLKDPLFAAALRREAALLVPERELKWDVLRPSLDQFDFAPYKKIAAFAGVNNMKVRGHVLVWHRANPTWLLQALKKKRGREVILGTHIRRVLTETAPVIRDWDVVNEAVHPLSKREDGLRPSPWLDALGPEYIPLAFHLAAEADPGLTLTYNDYGLEYGDGSGMVKRRQLLRLLQKMKKEAVPIHQLGLQSHLQAHRPLGGQEFLGFLKEVRAMDIQVAVTELDLDIAKLTGRADDRIALGQNYLNTYLSMIQKDGDVKTLVTWGLSDRVSWLRQYKPKLTGMLPLDADFKRQMMWESLKANWLGI